MRFRSSLALFLALPGLGLLLSSCSHQPAKSSTKQLQGQPAAKREPAKGGTRLLVHAGAALRPAMNELGQRFERKTGIKIDYNYKGSACLLPDVSMSKKGDAYIPGEVYFVDQAISRKVVKPDYKVVATMTTVLVTPGGNPKNIKSLADCARPGVRLGLGDPKAAAFGRAARTVFERAKLWDKVKNHIAMSGLNVSEVGNAIKLKQIDAAIIWNATAALYSDAEMVKIPIPAEYTVCSGVPICMVSFSKHAREAHQFIDYLATPEATKIFVAHGFGAPRAPRAECAPSP